MNVGDLVVTRSGKLGDVIGFGSYASSIDEHPHAYVPRVFVHLICALDPTDHAHVRVAYHPEDVTPVGALSEVETAIVRLKALPKKRGGGR